MEAILETQLDVWLDELEQRKEAWKHTTVAKRVALLGRLRHDTYRVAEEWVETCCRLKGIDPKSQRAGEEWAMGPMIVIRNLRLLEKQLQTPARHASARVTRSLPGDSWDLFQWPIFRGETWSGDAGTSPDVSGKLGLVLGAGNVSSIGATDVLYKMFIENQVVLLKMNPVHEALGPVMEQAFACLIESGFLKIVSGGAREGALAVQHPKVETIHVTGSHHTYEAIHKLVPHKWITAELGCVSPVIVAPGKWSSRQLAYQARHVAGMLTTNAGFNCNAAQILVTSKQWAQRDKFLDEVRRALGKVASRPAYYPGARDRYAGVLKEYPQAERLGPPGEDAITWTLVAGLDPEQPQRAFQEEAFCGVLYETALDHGEEDFLLRAADFCNRKLWGNLSASILISPASQKTQPWRRALEGLNYGAVGVNIWPGLIFALVNLPWGAFPGNTPDNIQSGLGFVHNTTGVLNPEKAVLYGPFWTPLKMPWKSGFPRMRSMARALTDFEYMPSWKTLLKAHWEFFRGGVGM
jgi:hypothetical protein